MARKFTQNLVIFIALVLVIVIGLVKDNQAQVSEFNSLEEVSDVSVGDPYYDALKSLVEYYGIDVIFPDGTFRGNQTLTRGEFVLVLVIVIGLVKDNQARLNKLEEKVRVLPD